jgi:hemerythrin HHE cation binding domain-containing protein
VTARHPGPIETTLHAEHRRIDALLEKATAAADALDLESYAAFRRALLRHIAQEEKILLPELRRLRRGDPVPIAARLRLEHGAIAALLVPPPSRSVIRTLRAVLEAHNPLEEGEGGLYETADRIAADEAADIAAKLRGAAEIPASSFSEGPKVLASVRRALERAGFRLVDG